GPVNGVSCQPCNDFASSTDCHSPGFGWPAALTAAKHTIAARSGTVSDIQLMDIPRSGAAWRVSPASGSPPRECDRYQSPFLLFLSRRLQHSLAVPARGLPD